MKQGMKINKDFKTPLALHDLSCICFVCKRREARAEKFASKGGGYLRKQMEAEMEAERQKNTKKGLQ